MANTRDLLVRINGDTSGLEKALGKAEKSSGGLGAAFKKAEGGSFALLGGLTAAAAGLGVFASKSIGAYNASVEASAKLSTNLLNVKGATEQHVEALKKQAAQLQSIGVIEDDVIIAGQSQLATFNLQGATIQKLTPKIADMVAQLKGHNATAEDMVTINNLVGKVMTGNVGALSRYGVTLSDTQKELLKNGNETERANILNEVLAQNYGKVNEALRKTPQGQMTAFKNTFGDFMELAGEFANKIVGPLVQSFNDWFASMGGPEGVLKSLKEKFEDLQPWFPVIIGALVGGLIPAFVALGVSIWTALAPLLPFIAAGAALGLGIKYLMDRFGGLDGVMQKLQPTLSFMAELWKGYLLPALESVWKAFQEKLLPALKELWEQVSPVLIPVLKVLGVILGGVIYAAIMLFVKSLEFVVNVLANVVTGISKAIDWVKGLGDWFGKVPGALKSAFSTVADVITYPFKTAFNGIADLWNNTVGKLSFTLPSWIPSIGGKGFSMPKIPKFDKGIENFAGGLAYVHGGEVLANLAPGTSVIPKSEVGNSGAAPIVFSPTFQMGMFAGMPTEYRELAERMWVEFTRIAQSNGIKLPPIGARVQ